MCFVAPHKVRCVHMTDNLLACSLLNPPPKKPTVLELKWKPTHTPLLGCYLDLQKKCHSEVEFIKSLNIMMSSCTMP